MRHAASKATWVGLVGKEVGIMTFSVELMVYQNPAKSIEDFRNWLRDRDKESVAKAKHWFLANRKALLDKQSQFREIYVALALGLLAPAEAQRSLKGLFFPAPEAACWTVALDRGAQWCAGFSDAIDRAKVAKVDRTAAARAYYPILRQIVDAHDLPTPEGSLFVHGWVLRHTTEEWHESYTYRTLLLREDVVAEPRLADLWPLVLQHDLAAQVPQYARVTTEFVTEGLLDRGDFIARCFTILVGEAKASTQ